MTSLQKGTSSMEKAIKLAPDEKQHHVSRLVPFRKGTSLVQKRAKSAPREQQHYLSAMISLKKEDAAIRLPLESAPKKQQRDIKRDTGGSKLAAAAPTKQKEDHVAFTGYRSSAVKAPKLVKQKGDYWTSTDKLKSQLLSKRKADTKVVAEIRRKRENLPDGSAKHYYEKTLDGRAKRTGKKVSAISAKGSYGHRRKLCISIGIIVGLIVLAGAAAGIYLFVFAHPSVSTIPSTTRSTLAPVLDEAGLLAYEAICVPQYIRSPPITFPNVNRKECIVGAPPSRNSCSGTTACTFYAYRAVWDHRPAAGFSTIRRMNRTVTIPLPYDEEVVPKRGKNTTQLLCRTTGDKLGLCNGSNCRGTRVEDKSTWYEKSNWEDNCDKPNPCWEGDRSAIETLAQNRVTRAECLKMDATMCTRDKIPYRAAVVWMQHLRCDSGKDRTRNTPCRGIPLKLWVCAKCNRALSTIAYVNSQCGGAQPAAWHCSFRCGIVGEKPVTTIDLADGAVCIPNVHGKTGYCFQKTCFHFSEVSVLNETNRHELEETGCPNKKAEMKVGRR